MGASSGHLLVFDPPWSLILIMLWWLTITLVATIYTPSRRARRTDGRNAR